MSLDALRPVSGPADEPEDLDQLIQAQIDEMPRELKQQWSAEYENAKDEDLPDLERRIRTFTRLREQVLYHTSPVGMDTLKHTEKDDWKIRDTLARIESSFGRADLFVGKGMTAEVSRDPDAPICYKTVTNFEKYAAWNSVTKEAQFLEKLEDLVGPGGVRTPLVQSVIDLPHIKAIAMEYLEAENIKVIIEKNRPLPPSFDVGIFFERVRAYVEEMHQRNIYHRDLHAGNILIGKDGTPYIIDFGQATTSFTPDDAYTAYDKTGQIRIVLTTDEAHVDATEAALRSYVAKRAQTT